MSKLYFKVASDWQEVVRLRDEISKLETQIKSMDANKAPQAVAVLNHQMQQTKQQMQGMITEAAKAGAVMDNDFKSKIYQSSQSVNDFTQKIINQKAVVKDVEADVKRLGESYRSALKNNPLSASGKLSEYTSAKKALDEEKAALFGLTQEQANARLSVKKLRDEYSRYKDEGKGVVSTTDGICISLKKAFAVIGGVAVIKQLGSEIIRVRGEFQSMQTAIETLVGKDMASNLIPQIKELAKTSPLTLTDMVGAEKMMLGFNINAEDTIRYLQALGDISMGNSQKFNSLTLAFSQMSATGKLMGQDLNQMINAGFNPLQQIAQSTGKSIATLKEEMSKGAISTEMVQKAFIDATSAGGKFFGMSENASKTINGQLSMMQDALDEVFNELGTKGEGVIMAGIQASTSLIQNYETVGKVLSGLVVTYGGYRAAVMLSTIATGKHTIAEVALTNVRVIARRAQMALNASMLTNPYVLLATVVVGAAAAMWAFHDGTTAAEKAQKKFNEEKEEAIKREAAHKSQIESLISTIQDETTAEMNRIGAMDKLKAAYPHIFAKYIDEKGHLRDIIGYKREIEEFDAKVSVGVAKRQADRAKQELINVNTEINYRQGSTTGASKFFRNKTTSELREMQSELLQSYQLKQSEYDKLAELDAKAKAKMDSTTVTQDKSYWENLKKNYQAELDALSDIEAAGKKGAALKNKIAGYDKKIGAFSANSYKQDKVADTLRKEQEKDKLLMDRQSREQIRSSEDLQNQVEQARINAMRDGSARTLEQMKFDHSKEMQQLERQQEDLLRKKIEDEKARFDAKEDEKVTAVNGYKKQTFDGSKITLSQSEKDVFSNQKMYLDLKQIGETQAYLNKERQSWNEYLSEYGNFQEKKNAITSEYNEKISNASTKGDKESLKKELENRIKEINLDELKSSINFVDIFGDLDSQSTEALTRMRDKLKVVIEQSAKDLKPNDLKALQDAFKDIDFKIAERNPFSELKQGAKEYKASTQDVIHAQEDLNKVMQGGEIITGTYTDSTGKICVKLLTQEQAEKRLATAQANRQTTLSSLTKAANNIGSKGMEVVNAGNEIVDMLENFGVAVPEAVGETLDGIGQTMSALESIDLTKPFSAITGSVGILAGIGNTIAGLLGFGSYDYSHYNEMKEQYDSISSIWDELISKKMEYLEISTTEERKRAEQEILDLISKQEQTARNLGLERLNSGSSLFSSSIGVRIRKGMSDEGWSQWDKFANSIGMLPDDIGGRLEGLFSLSSEQLDKLKGNAPDFWAKLDGDVRTYLEDIIKCGEKTEETTKKTEELWAGMSFDSMVDQFRDALSDMDSSTEDFADDFQQYMINAMIDSFVNGEVFQKKLKDWHKKLSEYSASDKSITENEKNDLQKEWDAIVKEGTDYRDSLFESMGFSNSKSTSQSSTSGGFETMSQDEGKELNGRFTALQIAGEEIKNQNALQSQSLNLLTFKADALLTVNTEVRNIADETRTLIANSYLELVQISENTGESAKYLKKIKSDMAEVKKNTKAMAG